MQKYPVEKAYFVLSNEAAGFRHAYVTQLALGHLVKLMLVTFTQYIMGRLAGNDDDRARVLVC